MNSIHKNVNKIQIFSNYYQTFILYYTSMNKAQGKVQRCSLTDYKAVLDYLELQYRSKGALYTIDLIKFIRLTVYKYTASEIIPVRRFFKTQKNGLPSMLPPGIRRAIENHEVDNLKDILTVLQISYLIDAHKEPDLSTIEDSPVINEDRINSISI
jgi:hypothetical protein